MAGRLCPGAFLCAILTLGVGAQEPLQLGAAIPSAPREFRGAWVATVDNIDWPSRPGLSVDALQRELDEILDAAASMRLNAVLFQVRPACDALYRSDLEPWSEWLTGTQGKAPVGGFDPLAYAIAGAQARGLELHAWINPFRARHRAAKSPLASDHPARAAMVEYAGELWLDPGRADARAHSLQVCLDIVTRYDVDGLHMDDYFYPYPSGGKAFPDDASFAAYRSSGGRLARSGWRRANVDAFVQTLHGRIKAAKSWVKFGISPFGIVRPGVPSGIQAGIDQYEDLAADVRKWVHEGWCDYLSPQLYWPIGQKAQSYATLLRYWSDLVPGDRMHLWIGNYASQAVSGKSGWSAAELLAQVERTRSDAGATGNVFFSMKVLRDDRERIRTKLREGPYELPALVPASPWLDREPPAAPGLRVQQTEEGDLEVRWSEDDDARWRTLYALCGDRWVLLEVVGRKPGIAVTGRQLERLGARAIAVSAVDRCGNESERVVRTLR
ncbi:MAG: glycoside hydrolase family 10 protein [Planctomycetota bacterium]